LDSHSTGSSSRGADHEVELTEGVVAQTERRVLYDEAVPAEEKIFSIFEEHTDILIKDRRDIYYGQKLTVTGGRSGLIPDWVVEKGNPADSTLAVRMVERQKEIYGRVPRQVAFDGGFASKANLARIKALGVTDASFAKKRGRDVVDLVKSPRVYRLLRPLHWRLHRGRQPGHARAASDVAPPRLGLRRAWPAGLRLGVGRPCPEVPFPLLSNSDFAVLRSFRPPSHSPGPSPSALTGPAHSPRLCFGMDAR